MLALWNFEAAEKAICKLRVMMSQLRYANMYPGRWRLLSALYELIGVEMSAPPSARTDLGVVQG